MRNGIAAQWKAAEAMNRQGASGKVFVPPARRGRGYRIAMALPVMAVPGCANNTC